MRKAILLATAILAVLALSAGALAYPVVVGTHSLSAAQSGTCSAPAHPKVADDSSGNETRDNETGDHYAEPASDNSTSNETGDHSGMSANETENETEHSSGSDANASACDSGHGSSDQNVSGDSPDNGTSGSVTDVSSGDSASSSPSDTSVGSAPSDGSALSSSDS
jgi:hypothetical protein